MILYLTTLIQDYSYDKISYIVEYYEDNVSYLTDSVYIHLGGYYNYRNLPDICVYNIYNPKWTPFTIPKRYIYSDMHI